LEDVGIDGRIILKWILKKWDGGMDWIDLAQGRDRWGTVLNTGMNLFLVPHNVRNFVTICGHVGCLRRSLFCGHIYIYISTFILSSDP
jgi:hypothetical protein